MNKYEEIIKVNSGLIYMIMNKYFKGYDKDDLYQVGVIGVIKAYNNYKNDHNTKFSTYAFKYIYGEMYNYINNIKNYIEFLFRDWDFLDLEIIYSIYKNNPELLESFLYIDVENYLELMPNDIVKEYQAMKERRKSSMDGRSNMTFNITGGQINIAKDNGNVNAIQNNGIGNNELDAIIGEIKNEDAEEIMDIVDMAREELAKTQPKVSRLRNCITLIAPMMTIANGIPTLSSNLQKFQEFIMNCIK